MHEANVILYNQVLAMPQGIIWWVSKKITWFLHLFIWAYFSYLQFDTLPNLMGILCTRDQKSYKEFSTDTRNAMWKSLQPWVNFL